MGKYIDYLNCHTKLEKLNNKENKGRGILVENHDEYIT